MMYNRRVLKSVESGVTIQLFTAVQLLCHLLSSLSLSVTHTNTHSLLFDSCSVSSFSHHHYCLAAFSDPIPPGN